jgi:hypothetical protein
VVPAHRPQRPRAPARPVTRPSASGGTSGEGGPHRSRPRLPP